MGRSLFVVLTFLVLSGLVWLLQFSVEPVSQKQFESDLEGDRIVSSQWGSTHSSLTYKYRRNDSIFYGMRSAEFQGVELPEKIESLMKRKELWPVGYVKSYGVNTSLVNAASTETHLQSWRIDLNTWTLANFVVSSSTQAGRNEKLIITRLVPESWIQALYPLQLTSETLWKDQDCSLASEKTSLIRSHQSHLFAVKYFKSPNPAKVTEWYSFKELIGEDIRKKEEKLELNESSIFEWGCFLVLDKFPENGVLIKDGQRNIHFHRIHEDVNPTTRILYIKSDLQEDPRISAFYKRNHEKWDFYRLAVQIKNFEVSFNRVEPYAK